jgi:hypothetical protein
MQSQHSALALLISVAGHGLMPKDALACSCLPGIVSAWPRAQVENVPTNTSVILGGSPEWLAFEAHEGALGSDLPLADAGAESGPPPDLQSLEGGVNRLVLHSAEQDEWITLAPRTVLPASGGCVSAWTVAIPEQPLTPNTTYELLAPGTSFQPTGAPINTFTTGDGEADFSATEVPDVLVVGDELNPASIVTLLVEQKPQVGLLLSVQGAAEPVTGFLLAEDQGLITLQLGGVECPELQFFDMLGNAVEALSLCEPDRCLRAESVGVSSCGGNPTNGLTLERYYELPEGCGTEQGPSQINENGNSEDAPTVSIDGETESSSEPREGGQLGTVDNENGFSAPPDPGEEGNLHVANGIQEDTGDAGGCSVTSRAHSSRAPGSLVLALALGAWVNLRRGRRRLGLRPLSSRCN